MTLGMIKARASSGEWSDLTTIHSECNGLFTHLSLDSLQSHLHSSVDCHNDMIPISFYCKYLLLEIDLYWKLSFLFNLTFKRRHIEVWPCFCDAASDAGHFHAHANAPTRPPTPKAGIRSFSSAALRFAKCAMRQRLLKTRDSLERGNGTSGTSFPRNSQRGFQSKS